MSKATAQAIALSIGSFAGAMTVLIGTDQLEGVIWALAAAALTAAALFFQNIAGNANGETKGYAQGEQDGAAKALGLGAAQTHRIISSGSGGAGDPTHTHRGGGGTSV